MDGNLNPFEIFLEWFEEAKRKCNLFNPEAFALATYDGKPKCRFLLLKKIDEDGFQFFTNYNAKLELFLNPYAEMVFYWDCIGKQVRIFGEVEVIPAEKSDEYFYSRPLFNQISAWASRQSEILENEEILNQRFEKFKKIFEGRKVPRPPYWGGFKMKPQKFEFLKLHPARLNDRTLFILVDGKWKKYKLYP